jgi:hypothetical protein
VFVFVCVCDWLLGCGKLVQVIPPYASCKASTSYSDAAIGTGYARGALNSPAAWFPLKQTVGQWWQMDVGSPRAVKGIRTQGRKGGDSWVQTYKVKWSLDEVTWNDVDGGASFNGNTNGFDTVTAMFSGVVVARFVRIYPQTKSGAYFGLRCAVMVEESGCPAGQYLKDCGGTSNGTCAGPFSFQFLFLVLYFDVGMLES